MINAEATRDRMVAAAWAGEILLAADPDGLTLEGRASREELDAVVQAAEMVRRVGYLLNQFAAAFHSTGTLPEEFTRVTDLTWRVVTRLDDEVNTLRESPGRAVIGKVADRGEKSSACWTTYSAPAMRTSTSIRTWWPPGAATPPTWNRPSARTEAST